MGGDSSLMMIADVLRFFAVILCGVALLGAGGCVMHRTVTEGGAVVAEGYVVESPIRGVR